MCTGQLSAMSATSSRKLLIDRRWDVKLRWLIVGSILGAICTYSLIYVQQSDIVKLSLLSGNNGNSDVNQTLSVQTVKYPLHGYSKWPEFLTDTVLDITTFQHKCLINGLKSNGFFRFRRDEPNSTKTICKDIILAIENIYNISSSIADINYPPEFEKKVKKWLGDQQLYNKALHQDLHFVFNKFSFEHTVYNPIRGKRPITEPLISASSYISELINQSSQSCDFCNYKKFTATDPLGRFESVHAFSASNAFKFDTWHSMFMPRQHNILNVTLEEFHDVYKLAWKWIRAVYKKSPLHQFPVLLFDMFPHGGASQVHPHIHAAVNSHHYYGQFESIRSASEIFYREYKINYFQQLQDIHMALNLTLSLGGITVIVPITSKKEYDIILLAENFDERIVTVIYQIIQGYFHRLKQYSFSSCLYLPPLSHDESGIPPVYFRIIPRGHVQNVQSEISSLELLSVN
ncbi:unnamed protein product [Didymodactylos carnosus]|uniref:Uncharacterized protein n=1 Tax=Didymodactylos carnosus TaxID=1234261 RepID=A0A813S0W8_9BILA|nr:unnamed protein product [Didymodactylos carnosus]CAF0801172.1 unnamed protein product [Didymodactylos carnosus]CAF3572647.1 unnamed protein product [Didymodactylos carnosus]CAF3584516.1 unnamed protein product [Didymodactylos carnosus]